MIEEFDKEEELDRFERPEGDNRRQRLAHVSTEPGWFVYDGEAVAIEEIPTVLVTKEKTYSHNPDGTVRLDAMNRPVMVPKGIPALTEQGEVQMGGPPKRIERKIETFAVLGRKFKKDVPRFVARKAILQRVRLSPHFKEVDKPKKEAPRFGKSKESS